MLVAGLAAIGGIGSLTMLPNADAEAQNTQPSAGSSKPVLLELFTSQGCSSCPPADRLAGKLAQDPALLVLSRPVTYWDRLGWKDTLGREANTVLQRGYAAKGNAGAGVYTPQIVVNGRHGAVGSNERNIRSLVHDAAMANRPGLRTTLLKSGAAKISVNGSYNGPAELVLVAYSSHENVRIGRGENGGRTVSYTNVVLDEMRIANAGPGKQAFTVPAAKMRTKGADRYAIILRRPDAGPVLAARFIGR